MGVLTLIVVHIHHRVWPAALLQSLYCNGVLLPRNYRSFPQFGIADFRKRWWNPINYQCANRNSWETVDNYMKGFATDGLRKLVSMSKDVFTCQRGHEKPFSQFGERFREYAQRYLSYCIASQIRQETQKFAMVLLENSKLPTSNFNTIVSLLVADAKEAYTLIRPGMVYMKKDSWSCKTRWINWRLIVCQRIMRTM